MEDITSVTTSQSDAYHAEHISRLHLVQRKNVEEGFWVLAISSAAAVADIMPVNDRFSKACLVLSGVLTATGVYKRTRRLIEGDKVGLDAYTSLSRQNLAAYTVAGSIVLSGSTFQLLPFDLRLQTFGTLLTGASASLIAMSTLLYTHFKASSLSKHPHDLEMANYTQRSVRGAADNTASGASDQVGDGHISGVSDLARV